MFSESELQRLLTECTLCPHACKANRLMGATGFCKSDAQLQIASICVHKGEEPALSGESGICNVFFSHCNLRCIFCQNHQISRTENPVGSLHSLTEVLDKIISILDTGIHAVGFVSPSHMVTQFIRIVDGLHQRHYFPTIVWNSNGYDSPETLRMLESYIDVYLPDFKYMNPVTAKEFSGINNYPGAALAALKEMYFQKGSKLFLNDEGMAEKGLIIRHLVLPGKVDETCRLLEIIADEISTKVTISLMAQYYPTENVISHPLLSRNITKEEYQQAVVKMDELGFAHGWTQEFESSAHYRPDFEEEHPFEK